MTDADTPDSTPRPRDLPFDIDLRRLNKGVGYVALGLPVALGLVSLLTNTCFNASISHYYFSRIGGDILVGALSFIGLLLIFFYSFRAPGREGCLGWHWYDVALLKLAGMAAVIVAFVPTTGSGCTYDGEVARVLLTGAAGSEGFHPPGGTVDGTISYDFWASFAAIGAEVPMLLKMAHFGAAGVMFLILGYFSMSVFTRDNSTTSFAAGNRKDRRNAWYRALGRVILAVVGVLAIKAAALELVLPQSMAESIAAFWDSLRLTFVFEALGLMAFGLSWMIKGRFIPAFEDAAAKPQPRAA
ncbi:hypothetical protein [uncultured Roseovarius sp.]|uniref:hypothetical protein n=1 Tax=uncultured Roseovarius sp. TaxID=293344 RepID=UPI002616BD6D|nr:hypothetical protein [uncultured Roseovarius sp.]